MPTANDALRRARMRTESMTNQGEALSRQELADLVNAHVWAHHQKEVVVDANYIGKLERGVIGRPSQLYREALRSVLGATDAALGFSVPHRAVVKLVDMDLDRKQFLRAAALGVGALAFPLTDLWEATEPVAVADIPSRIGQPEIDQIHAANRMWANWDDRYGAGLAREGALAQLRVSAALLNAAYPTALRGPLLSTVGVLAQRCAYMLFDAYDHPRARRVFRFALACATEARDWHLRAKVLSSMARQEVWVGQPDDGLTWIELALVRADRLTPTERAMLHTGRARAMAKMGRVQDTLIAVGTADDHFAHRIPANDPESMAFYDSALHAGDTAGSLFDLAVRGRSSTEATTRLSAAVARHGDDYARSRTLSKIKLASLTMATGDPQEATTIGNAALDAASGIKSQRMLDNLRELGQYSLRHHKIPEVEDLRQRLTTLVLAT